MTSPSRQLARAARRLVDQQAAKVDDLPSGRFFATVDSVTAGAARDGVSATVQIRYRGSTVTAAGYAAAYTPAVGDRVLCVSVDHQPVIVCRVVGQP